MKSRKWFYGLIAFVLFCGVVTVFMARPTAAQISDPVERLMQETSGAARVSYHAETGKVRFIGTDATHPMLQPGVLNADATPEEAARQFLGVYGSAFGLVDQAKDLIVERSQDIDGGRSEVRFQQVYQGVPVVAGELIVQMNAAKNVLSVSGELLPDLNLDVTPTLDPGVASRDAIAAVAAKYGVSSDSLTTSKPELWLVNQALLGGPGPRVTALAWRMDVTPNTLDPIKEYVLVEAHIGLVLVQFNQIDTALNRMTFDAGHGTSLPGTLLCDESNPTCTGQIADAQTAHIYAGDTYNFYMTNHGRDSIDNAGMTIVSSVRYGSNYQNAYWDGSQMVYGDGYGFANADDVVAHELTHGVTDHESRLFYYYQSGAINESFSDVWGEFVDQTNGKGNDDPSVKWLMGEDVTGLGPIRSMSNPPMFNDPDKMSSSYYYCSTMDTWDNQKDNGGVHHNSGINNKAAFLMTDGGSFNGQTITGLGITKVAKIYYEVQTHLLTSGSDYEDLADDLQQACTNLIGTAGITTSDCQQVQKAILAVEMNSQPSNCAAADAPICPAGQVPTNLFFDNMENTNSGNWVHGALSGSEDEWYYPESNLPYWDGRYAKSGTHNLAGVDLDVIGDYAIAMTTDVTLPAGASYLHFYHSYGFQGANQDGGVVDYSTDNGTTWNDAGPMFADNGYNGTIATGSGNPLGGRPAFVSDSYGYTSSRLNLTSQAGGTIRFRFRIGTDNSGYDLGWYIDDVRIYTCAAAGPTNTPSPTRTKTTTPTNWTPPATQNNYLSLLHRDKTPTPTLTPTPTPIPPTPTSAGIVPGLWAQNDTSCSGCSWFYVTTDHTHVDDFSVHIRVNGCGDYIVTHKSLVKIKNGSFSFTGSYFANGTFDSDYTAHGKLGFSKYLITGCGYISGTLKYTSAWVNSSQPIQADQGLLPDLVTVQPASSEPIFLIETVEP